MAHQRYTQFFNAVIDVHARADVAGAHVGECLDAVGVAEVPVAPGVLADQILGGGGKVSGVRIGGKRRKVEGDTGQWSWRKISKRLW